MSCFSCIFRPCMSGQSSQIPRPRRFDNPVYKLDFQQVSTYPSRERLTHTLSFDMIDDKFLDPMMADNEEEKNDVLLMKSDTTKKMKNDNGFGIDILFDTEEEDDENKEDSEAVCLICLDDLFTGEIVNLNICKCRFHADCLKEYIGEGIITRAFPIKCPGSECLKEILQEDLYLLLKENAEQFNKYKKFYMKFIVESDPSKFSTCPDTNCQYAVLIELKPLNKEISCPGCNNSYCLECKRAWHQGLTCKQAKKLEEKNKKDLQQEKKRKEAQDKKDDRDFLKYSKNMQFRQCPKCGQVIEKIAGCSAVTCTRCNGMFCYFCGRKGDGHKCKHRPTCSMF